MKWLTIFSLGFLTLGCSDHMISKVEPNEQDILVHPEHINFGHLVSGEESGHDTFAVINTGDHELTIMAPVLVSGNSRFSFLVEDGEYVIGEGELMDFEVGYIPETFEENGAYIEILSDDPDEPVVIVTLEGYGDAPVIVVDPLDFDYGSISIGCDNEERITVANEGNITLTVESITQMVTQPVDILMEFGALPDPPWSIDPGYELDFLVSYIPTDTGVDASEIEIVSNDPLTPFIETIQYGDGDVEQWVTDLFEQEEVPLLDVLWVIDNSGSMSAFQSHVATNMSSFMSVFLVDDPDFHMGFITTDSPAFQGGYFIDTTSTDPAMEAATLISGIGVSGNAYEKGIEYSYNATASSAYAGPGSDFFREDATLVIIYVSDEPDFSAGGWSAYTSHFSSLKDSDRLAMISIIGDYPSGCSYAGPPARTIQYGAGYYDITNFFGGEVLSLCATDWGSQMEDLAETVSSRRTFPLSESDPIEDTIEVYVNGQLVTGSWTYDPTDNDVTFNEGEEPEPGDTIEIIYATWGCGE